MQKNKNFMQNKMAKKTFFQIESNKDYFKQSTIISLDKNKLINL